ncbi:L-ascorbate metabolism protein UlaG (beta-lactamase superfamily) [Croceifilum oryzae]|uniref:UPF0173 metal-dependent hydrolase J2Z48_000894 n=1 Tax=Croceifilum oryzae TaxID=1553429 RepID=A0AAJ1WPP3_9BACL|nr:metal-dependent hydrolase [Croceifilum oryzae]MDQ0416727.1 L-ascorbate metabolism protein UlaG (beta-lactamase superfamily) [Croceifilum oryzae]
MKITFHGHAAVEIIHQGLHFWIDPFLTGNPAAAAQVEDQKADVILLTHGHNDHVGDTIALAEKSDALVIAPYELALYLEGKGVARTHGMGIGGPYDFPFGRVMYTNAIHGSSFVDPETNQIIYAGQPGGILVTLGDRTIYHAGDTSLFSDMKLIGIGQKIDLALLPIGGNFTMGPQEALLAAEWIGAEKYVPIHYNTFPPIKQDGEKFVRDLQEKGLEGVVLEPHESLHL